MFVSLQPSLQGNHGSEISHRLGFLLFLLVMEYRPANQGKKQRKAECQEVDVVSFDDDDHDHTSE